MSDARAASAMDHALGRKLRLARMGAGLSQQALADRLGITFQQVQKYEKGANRIAASRLVSIAGALNQPISYFLKEGKVTVGKGLRNGAAPRETNDAAAGILASIENPKVRRRVVDLLRAIIAADEARRVHASRAKSKARGKTRAARSRAV
jgi:transcriptional regulator with XRE-family HTH domain